MLWLVLKIVYIPGWLKLGASAIKYVIHVRLIKKDIKDLVIVSHLSVSFIIPAYNEELFLPQVIKNIKLYVPESVSYEIIVADNGSEDKTVKLAEDLGAKVFIDKKATIGRLRNRAVEHSKGQVLVFLDADMLLTDEWRQNFVQVYESLMEKPDQVTGSRCGIPAPASWVEEIWFQPLVSQSSKYINSGHLITSRLLFDRIGGFDVKLETGEDCAFGIAASQLNAGIINNSLLAVVHKGYPKTIYQFVRREMWHGRGDCTSLQSLLESKVALVAILFMTLHVFAVAGFVLGSKIISTLAVLLIVIMCMLAAVFKHEARSIKKLLLTSLLYYFYFVSRFFSCLSFISVRSVKRAEDV